ncbi:MAG: glutamine amidotransferase [Longispora sp.]|nr:glutamine amidotransferase [Longispora sp. (in: high G+C Gram-positive bacteria)]
MSTETIRIIWVYPDLLSTYGDRGNLLVMEQRARRRGLVVDSAKVHYDQLLPDSGDIYLLGGGEDRPQVLAARKLREDGGLRRAVERGASVLAVCAGYQLLGTSFYGNGEQFSGLELIDMHSNRGESRAVGELRGEATRELGLPTLTGFENHGGRTHLGAGVQPLARVTHGVGNDGATEGVWSGRMLGTYLHGPALARNPAIADLLLSWVTDAPLPALDDSWTAKLRTERLAA